MKAWGWFVSACSRRGCTWSYKRYQQLLTAVVLIGVVHAVWCAVTVPVTWYTPTCPTAELPRFTSYEQYIGSKYIIPGLWGTDKYLKKAFRNCDIVKRGRDAFDWLSMLLTALTSLGDKRASHLPQQLHNVHCTHSEPVWCSHWVASVEIRYHHSTFPDILQERLIQAA